MRCLVLPSVVGLHYNTDALKLHRDLLSNKTLSTNLFNWYGKVLDRKKTIIIQLNKSISLRITHCFLSLYNATSETGRNVEGVSQFKLHLQTQWKIVLHLNLSR